jgi:hypothetical protein
MFLSAICHGFHRRKQRQRRKTDHSFNRESFSVPSVLSCSFVCPALPRCGNRKPLCRAVATPGISKIASSLLRKPIHGSGDSPTCRRIVSRNAGDTKNLSSSCRRSSKGWILEHQPRRFASINYSDSDFCSPSPSCAQYCASTRISGKSRSNKAFSNSTRVIPAQRVACVQRRTDGRQSPAWHPAPTIRPRRVDRLVE